MDPLPRDRGYRKWKKAVARSVDWLDDDDDDDLSALPTRKTPAESFP
jgi:hypothetical protein